jgi:hypothetical protein
MSIFTTFTDIVIVIHKQQSNINREFQISEFSAMRNGILEKVVHSLNQDVNDHHEALSIWRATYWKWLSAVQLLVSKGYIIKLVLHECK